MDIKKDFTESDKVGTPKPPEFVAISKADLAQLQLENGVKDEAIKFVLEKCTLYGPHDRAIEKMKRALSTSTKSSLMEKVRNLVEIASRYNFTNWPEFMSALTEVKKELPHA